jgi:hypothetical protein
MNIGYFTSFLVFLNVGSLRNKLNDLTDFIVNSDKVIHVIVLDETRLKPHEFHLFNIHGYFSFNVSREKNGGGVSVFILRSFDSANVLETLEYENSNFLLIHLCFT